MASKARQSAYENDEKMKMSRLTRKHVTKGFKTMITE